MFFCDKTASKVKAIVAGRRSCLQAGNWRTKHPRGKRGRGRGSHRPTDPAFLEITTSGSLRSWRGLVYRRESKAEVAPTVFGCFKVVATDNQTRNPSRWRWRGSERFPRATDPRRIFVSRNCLNENHSTYVHTSGFWNLCITCQPHAWNIVSNSLVIFNWSNFWD